MSGLNTKLSMKLVYKLAPYGEAQVGRGAYVSSRINVLVQADVAR